MSLLGLHCLKPRWKRNKICFHVKLLAQLRESYVKGLGEAATVGRVLERQTLLKPLILNCNCFNACDSPCNQDRDEQPTHCSHPLKVPEQTAHFKVVCT